MKVLDLLISLNAEEEPYHGYSRHGNEFLEECGIEDCWVADKISLPGHSFTCRPIKTWMCTDTLVGYYAIYHRGEFICMSYQPARKERMEFYWLSQEVYNKIRDYIHSIVGHKTEKISIIDMDEEVGELFT
jgi:hypothetical protein